jgi:hypothetical protein
MTPRASAPVLDRTALVLVLAVLLLCAGAGLRPRTANGLPAAQFTARKVLWGPRFDLVLLGNSRVERGVSPAAMAEALPGVRIANLGMAGCGLDAGYLRAADAVLDPHSARPCIVIGVSPGALCETAVADNAFLTARRQQPVELWLAASSGPAAGWLAPYTTLQLKRLFGRGQGGEYSVRHADGWEAFYNVPGRGRAEKLANYRKLFERDKVSARMTADLLVQVRAWVQHGVRVYGFRPPAAAEMTALEDELSGFDERVFARQFTAAGGTWLLFDQSAYRAPDGSHLDAPEAERFSRALGGTLAAAPALAPR